MSHTHDDRAKRRTKVRRLAHEGLSQRAIAVRLKCSKDTVRRDFEALARDGADEGAPDVAHTDAPAPSPAAHPARATMTQLPPLPGAHPDAIRAAQLLGDLDPDDVSHPAHTRTYLRGALARATDLVAHLGAGDPIERQQLRVLAARLHTLADEEATAC